MSAGRLMIAGAGSGVGKTTIATGIMSRLARRYKIQAFKVGPDFIDPMYHSAATGRPSRNLDSFFMDRGTLRNLFGWATSDADMAVIEGVRGLYDGLTATGDQGSSAEIAKILDVPVILVVNARSLAKSAAAHVLGFKMLDPDIRIEGVILNQVSGRRHREKATEAVESLTGTRVLGAIERRAEHLQERHLGLITMPEQNVEQTLCMVEECVEDLDMEALLEISRSHGDETFDERKPFLEAEAKGIRIAVPQDRSFSFYYPENLEALEAAGARICRFKPTDGERIPDCDAIYLGGGYPEVYMRELSENRDFTEGLETASAEGKTILGECGGMMALCRSITSGEGEAPMAGIFPRTAELTEQRQGLSYVKARSTSANPIFPEAEVRAHEFHYTRLRPTPIGPFAYDILRGAGMDGAHDGMVARRTVGTYMHQHALATRSWGISFVKAALKGSK